MESKSQYRRDQTPYQTVICHRAVQRVSRPYQDSSESAMRLNFGHLKVRLSRATFFGRRGGGGGMLGKNLPKIDYVILCKRPILCFTLNSKPYLSCFADYRGGGGGVSRPPMSCPFWIL